MCKWSTQHISNLTWSREAIWLNMETIEQSTETFWLTQRKNLTYRRYNRSVWLGQVYFWWIFTNIRKFTTIYKIYKHTIFFKLLKMPSYESLARSHYSCHLALMKLRHFNVCTNCQMKVVITEMICALYYKIFTIVNLHP